MNIKTNNSIISNLRFLLLNVSAVSNKLSKQMSNAWRNCSIASEKLCFCSRSTVVDSFQSIHRQVLIPIFVTSLIISLILNNILIMFCICFTWSICLFIYYKRFIIVHLKNNSQRTNSQRTAGFFIIVEGERISFMPKTQTKYQQKCLYGTDLKTDSV